MTKITHKGLWFKYSSLSSEDKNTSKKVFLWALLCGFLFGLSSDKSSLTLWSEIFHPSLFYIMPVLTLIAGFFTIKYSFELYKNQDELYKKFHDFSLMAGFLGFAIFGFILHYVSIYTNYQPAWTDYGLCSILGMVIGQVYFYKKFYE
jgi:ascorbate-specific PTS system EIIC-type component UlaA|tara:strand:+ start:358 stop:801 length:444 start_codon:yes stop_codon:yes gene_type:complete